jgi:transposase
MEVFTTPPLREKRPIGRQPKLTHETRLLVGRKVTSKEMTYSAAAKAFGISEGAVGTCVLLFKNQGHNERKNARNKERNLEIDNYQHQAQIKELKLEIGELYLENQMLKKILNRSQQIKKSAGSVITSTSSAASQKDAE